MASLKDKLFGKGNAFNTRLVKKTEKAKPAAKAPAKKAAPKKTAKKTDLSGPKRGPILADKPAVATAKASGKRSPFSPTQDRGSSGVAGLSLDRANAGRGMGPKTRVSKGQSTASISSPKSFMKDAATLNNFRQKESRRASDEATGKANAPAVKKAIGKFALGKAYKG